MLFAFGLKLSHNNSINRKAEKKNISDKNIKKETRDVKFI